MKLRSSLAAFGVIAASVLVASVADARPYHRHYHHHRHFYHHHHR